MDQANVDESSGVTGTDSANEEVEKQQDKGTMEIESEDNSEDHTQKSPPKKVQEKKQTKRITEKRKTKISDQKMLEFGSLPKSKLRRLTKGRHLNLLESRHKFKLRKKNG